MMTSNVDRMVEAALARAGSETLVKRLRCEADGAEFSSRYAYLVGEAADRIEQLEKENDRLRAGKEKLREGLRATGDQLAAEKAQADELLRLVNDDGGDREAVRAAYRKARRA